MGGRWGRCFAAMRRADSRSHDVAIAERPAVSPEEPANFPGRQEARGVGLLQELSGSFRNRAPFGATLAGVSECVAYPCSFAWPNMN